MKYEINNDIMKRFDGLMSLLNAEDNGVAASLRYDIFKRLCESEEVEEELNALYNGGVDNWSGYDECFPYEYDEEV